ncbi:hypothetical protein D3C80_1112160 [compost metagenome]
MLAHKLGQSTAVDQRQRAALQLRQAGRRLSFIATDQHSRGTEVSTAEHQLLLTQRTVRQAGDHLRLALMQLRDHPLDTATGPHLELQAGAPGNQLQDIQAQAAQLALAIAKAQRQQLFVDQHRHRRIAVQPALLGGTELHRLGLVPGAGQRAPALADPRLLALAEAGQRRVHQAWQRPAVFEHGKAYALAWQGGIADLLDSRQLAAAQHVATAQGIAEKDIGVAKRHGSQGAETRRMQLQAGQRELLAQLLRGTVAFDHRQPEFVLAPNKRAPFLLGNQQRTIFGVGSRQVQTRLQRLLCGYRTEQVDRPLAQGRHRLGERSVGMYLDLQVQLLGDQPGIVGGQALEHLAGAEDVERRVVPLDHPQAQLPPLPQPAQFGAVRLRPRAVERSP